PGCHGYDLAPTLDALDRGAGQYRAVALLEPDTTDARIAELDRRGVRAVRYHFVAHLANAGWNELAAMAPRIAAYGWHICVHADAARLPRPLGLLRTLRLPCVIDRMGRAPASEGVGGGAFPALLGLRDHPGAWVKRSGLDRVSGARRRPYADGEPLVSALLEAM